MKRGGDETQSTAKDAHRRNDENDDGFIDNDLKEILKVREQDRANNPDNWPDAASSDVADADGFNNTPEANAPGKEDDKFFMESIASEPYDQNLFALYNTATELEDDEAMQKRFGVVANEFVAHVCSLPREVL